MKKLIQKGSAVIAASFVGLLIIGSIFFCAIGYGMNIYKLTRCDFQAPYKAEILHTIGLVPIVGIFTGHMDLGK